MTLSTSPIRQTKLLSVDGAFSPIPVPRVLGAIPCYNEELAIASLVLKSKKYVDEVVVIDDGSTDDTAQIAQEAGAVVIKHSTNKGYGAALKSCFSYARSSNFDLMIILDGDGQHDPDFIPVFLNRFEENNTDIVIGSRFLNNDKTIPLYRTAGMKVLDTFTKMAGNVTTTDSQCGYRGYNRKAIQSIDIREETMGAGSEILTQAKNLDLHISEVPIKVRYDVENPSSQNPFAHGFDVINSIIWHIVQKRPLLYIGVPGFVLVSIATMFGLLLLQLYNRSQYFSLPTAMLTAIFGIIGVIFLFMGLTFHIIKRIK
jgi:Glycosyltransferases involved in cell wall biogenesis